MRLLILASFAAVSAAAQPALDSTAHRIPFASSGNTLELAVANTGAEEALEGVTVRLTSHPEWLVVSPETVTLEALAPGAEVVATFSFDVDRAAPVAEPAEVTLEVQIAGGLRWTKTVRLEVEAPRAFSLSAAYPNPFRTTTTLAFELPVAARVRLSVFDLLGREVARLLDNREEAGRHEVEWRALGVASGVYVCRVVVEDDRGGRSVHSRRVTLLR